MQFDFCLFMAVCEGNFERGFNHKQCVRHNLLWFVWLKKRICTICFAWISIKAFLSEHSKQFDSSLNVFVLVGSNPIGCIYFVFPPHTHYTSFDTILIITETPHISKKSLIHISTDIISKHNTMKNSSNHLNMLSLLDCDSRGIIIYLQL